MVYGWAVWAGLKSVLCRNTSKAVCWAYDSCFLCPLPLSALLIWTFKTYSFPPNLFQKVVEKLKREHFRDQIDSPGIAVAKSGCQLPYAVVSASKGISSHCRYMLRFILVNFGAWCRCLIRVQLVWVPAVTKGEEPYLQDKSNSTWVELFEYAWFSPLIIFLAKEATFLI